MFGWLQSLLGLGGRTHRRRIRASYDAAATTAQNRRHWDNADNYGPVLASDLSDRKTLRERARYEAANNSYAKGITLTLANNLIGIGGPRLQVLTSDQVANRAVEFAWRTWTKAIRLPNKLRVMKLAKTIDGEAFALFRSNPMLPTSVQLDLRLVEADQVTTPALRTLIQLVDGIEFDDFDNPTAYHVLKLHPGDPSYYANIDAYDRVPARQVLHWFRDDRPGQPRGISELTPALELFAQLRRFTQATLDAAETAAHFAAILKSNLPPNEDEDLAEGDPFDELEIARRMMTTLPNGYDMVQFKSEHPATTHEMFVMALLREIGRCLNMPWNIVAGDSSKANYSSARLDYLIYRQAIDVERDDCEIEVLEPTFAEWLQEASRVPNLLPDNVPAYAASLPHLWHWPAWEPVDPFADEQAASEGLTNGTRSLADITGPRGQDWRALIRQQAEEELERIRVRRELGVENQAAQTPGNGQAAAAAASSGA